MTTAAAAAVTARWCYRRALFRQPQCPLKRENCWLTTRAGVPQRCDGAAALVLLVGDAGCAAVARCMALARCAAVARRFAIGGSTNHHWLTGSTC
eukprot:249425-Chlamydomonas_euryale.AAC.5